MKFTGICKAALPQQSGTSQRTGNAWVSQEFVFEELNQRFPMSMCARVFGADKIAEFGIQQGMSYEIDFDITANQSQKTGGYFNSLNIFRVTPITAQGAQVPNQQAAIPQQGFQAPPQNGFGQPQGQPQWGGMPQQGGFPQPQTPPQPQVPNAAFPGAGGFGQQGAAPGSAPYGQQGTDANGNPLPF